jgi:hypothetical protein
MKRIMIFIDGNNFESAVNNLYGQETRLDYSKLADLVANKRNGDLIRFYYYTATGTHDKRKAENTHRFVNHLIICFIKGSVQKWLNLFLCLSRQNRSFLPFIA